MFSFKNFDAVLREMRLMKDQPAYRFVLLWVVIMFCVAATFSLPIFIFLKSDFW